MPSPAAGASATPGNGRKAPRSKSGCWTCRVRKVKCDERRPTCGQCSRLQIHCEGYSSRFSFRDDTQRVMKRMASVTSTVGNPVFDPHYALRRPSIQSPMSDDPPHLELEHCTPGTKYIILDATSFEGYDQNGDDSDNNEEGGSRNSYSPRQEQHWQQQPRGEKRPGSGSSESSVEKRRRALDAGELATQGLLAMAGVIPTGPPPRTSIHALVDPTPAAHIQYSSHQHWYPPPPNYHQHPYHQRKPLPYLPPVQTHFQPMEVDDNYDDEPAEAVYYNEDARPVDAGCDKSQTTSLPTPATTESDTSGSLRGPGSPSPSFAALPPSDIVITHTIDNSVTYFGQPPSSATAKASATVSKSTGVIPLASICELESPSARLQLSEPAPRGVQTFLDRELLVHYLRVVAPKLMAPNRGPRSPFVQIFVELAKDSPPVTHAILAISALNMSKMKDSIPLEALVHYNQAATLLSQSLGDPKLQLQDGTLGTICLLVLYEITAAENDKWKQHLKGAREIILARGRLLTDEQRNREGRFLTWWLGLLDSYAAMSAGGDGRLIQDLVEQDMLPIAGEGKMLPTLKKTKQEVEEHKLAGPMYKLFQDMVVWASRLWNFAKWAKQENPTDEQKIIRSKELGKELDAIWAKRSAGVDQMREKMNQAGSVDDSWPMIVAHQVMSYYRACRIHLFRSTYPSAPQTPALRRDVEEVLTIARYAGRSAPASERRYLLFPLFLAGVETWVQAEREEVLTILLGMEGQSVGHNYERTRQLLEEVLRRQEEIDHAAVAGECEYRRIDWEAVMKDMHVEGQIVMI
ncbi:hypothetical protein YB2330_005007 [Saitoella coloradoensis]